MDPIIVFALVTVGIFAGVIGAMFGMGGGIIFVPFLTIVFGLSASEAVAVSLVGIVASSVGAASSYVKEGRSNIRLGLLLETTTVIGAIIGALLAGIMSNWMLLCVFSVMLIYSALHMLIHKEHVIEPIDDEKGPLVFQYDDEKGESHKYKVDNVKGGLAGCAGAGVLASMTGVGGGAIKVPIMNIYMHVPIKIASATSNYMIGITSLSGAIIFFLNGDVLLDYAAGISIGAFIGALIGVKISGCIKASSMRSYLAIILLIVAAVELMKAGGLL
jgi:uncharacterized protein